MSQTDEIAFPDTQDYNILDESDENDHKVGDEILAIWEGDNTWYPAKILRKLEDNSFEVKFAGFEGTEIVRDIKSAFNTDPLSMSPDVVNYERSNEDEEKKEDEEDLDATLETKKTNTGSPVPADIDLSSYKDKSDKDDEESDDEDTLKKLERDIDNAILVENHPEIIQNNYNEILALCNIVRNDKGLIVDELHRTYPFITKYEYARIIGIRSKQLNNGADPFIKLARGVIDGFTIAKLEMDAKKVPFIIARPLPNGSREYWKVQDLEMIHF